MCPDCLVDLVVDPDATVRCRHCGRDWPATMASCPDCLAELRPDPDAALEAMGRILAMGDHLPRAAGTDPFADGPACTLLRLAARGPLVYIGSDGLIQAAVAGSEGWAVPPLVCNDGGDVLFRLMPYEPADAAVVAVGSDGAALATFLRSGTGMDVRDEASAPVARLVRRRDGFDLVETGGGALAAMGSSDHEIDGWIDDSGGCNPSVTFRCARWPLSQWSSPARCSWVGPGRPGPAPSRRRSRASWTVGGSAVDRTDGWPKCAGNAGGARWRGGGLHARLPRG